MEPKTIKIDDVEYVRKDEKQMAQSTDGLTYAIIRTYSAMALALAMALAMAMAIALALAK